MTPLRIAVVGAGKLGGYHATLAAASDDFELVAVVDPVAETREALAAKTGAKPVADISEVIDQIDAAVLATPTRFHKQGAVALLEQGIHTLVEKPLAPSLAEADAIVAASQRSGAVLQVGHVERFNPALQAAGEAINQPRFIQATRTSGYTFRSTDIGAVLDLMIHDIDLVLALAKSEVVNVSAMGLAVLGSPEAGAHEDMVTTQLTFANGCVAQLTASRVSYELRREMQLICDDAFVALDFAKGSATVVRPNAEVLARAFDGESLTAERKAELFAGKMFEDVLQKTTHEAPAVNAIELEQQDFAQAIRTGEAPQVDGRAARNAIAVAERILRRVDEHAWDRKADGRVGPFAQTLQERATRGLKRSA